MATADETAVDRAGHELTLGRPVNISGVDFYHPEFIGKDILGKLKSPKLIITSKRAQALGEAADDQLRQINLKGVSIEEIQVLISGQSLSKKIKSTPIQSPVAEAALELAQLMELLPAAVSSKTKKGLKVTPAAVLNYRQAVNCDLREVVEAPLTLKDAKNARIKAFRAGNGGNDHYALIIGEPGKTPLARIHSSCYTGDLLGSLACDCGDQLRSAIRMMDEAGGGILIYLMQEGRGIGLINKLRAYKLQASGLDTVEANEFLGFDDEERSFDAAAKILKLMNIEKIKLITNNPKKSAALERFGITIKSRVPLVVGNQHNQSYLDIKSSKSGHII